VSLVLARVMTFYAASDKIADLVTAMRSELPPRYESIPGYRGILVLEKPGGNHIIAITFWDGQEGVEASEDAAADNAKRIGHASGTTVSVHVYDVMGTSGLFD